MFVIRHEITIIINKFYFKQFKAVSSTDTHSSSVVDLFTSFNQTIDFLKRLNWPNEYQAARYMTSLSRVC